MHKRNRHKSGYNFKVLSEANPDLLLWMRDNGYGVTSIDFSIPEAVTQLNRAILLSDYGLRDWQLAEGFLCPPVPGRADYVHEVADLLSERLGRRKALGSNVTVLDIGTGANLIYPIIGRHEYGWRFIASELNEASFAAATKLLKINPELKAGVSLRKQSRATSVFKGIINSDDSIQVTLCNPPFHESAQAAGAANQRKRDNLNIDGDLLLNFGGQASELWCQGGEKLFIKRMIRESQNFKSQVQLFTTLVSKKKSLPPLIRLLKQLGCKDFQIIDMEQGQKQSRILVWQW